MTKTPASPDPTGPEASGVLLERFRAGDVGAFTALVERFQAPLLRHARGILGGGSSPEDPEDVVQEAFLRLAQAPPDLANGVHGDPAAGHGQLAAWLHTVTRNLCMDLARSGIRRRQREERAAVHEATGGGIAAVDASDTHAAVEACMQDLPAAQREVLVLRLLDDKSYAEIAAITGKKVGTVGWLISVGLKALSQDVAPLLFPTTTTLRGDA